MLLIRALLVWSLIGLHVVGAAAYFRRFFPRESPWFGFIVPGLALVLLMNFIEHLVAVPTLVWLLPVTTILSITILVRRDMVWKGFLLPTGIFLGAFAFTFLLRALRPDISASRDGVQDLCMMSCFTVGEKLPPTLNWYPPFHLSQYYILGQYGISVLIRLFGLDVGTGFNYSSALLSAFDCLLGAASAWVISRKKIWVTIAAAVLVQCAANGATAYLWFTTPNLDPNTATILLQNRDNPNDHNFLWKYLHDSSTYARRELMVPGTWSWLGSFHSTCGGLFLSLFCFYALTEVLRRRPSNWPWIWLLLCPVMGILTSTWSVPLQGLLVAGGLFWVWYYGLRPQNFRFVAITWGLAVVLLTPMLLEFLTTQNFPLHGWTDQDSQTEPVEFLVMWWPIYIPWFVLLFTWRTMHPAVRTVAVILPLFLTFVEFYTIGCRLDWTGKLWGYAYGVAWLAFFPAFSRRRGFVFRSLTVLVFISGFFSFIAWSQYTLRTVDWLHEDVLHMEGTGPFRWDSLRGKILQGLTDIHQKTLLTGKSAWSFCDSPMLAAFTGNRTYITWSTICDQIVCGTTYGRAYQRETEMNDFYDGKAKDPLLFLRYHDIAAVVIYPLDGITNETVASLKKQLSPYYEYEDYKEGDGPNAGLFIYHPEIVTWPPNVLIPLQPASSPAPAVPAPFAPAATPAAPAKH